MDARQVINKLEEKKSYLEKTYHIEEIGLFGSVARGEQTPTSDIDILIILPVKEQQHISGGIISVIINLNIGNAYFPSHSSLVTPACFNILKRRSTLISLWCGFGMVKTSSPLIM
jgi:predicted nucleotidyltransferase